MNKYSTVFMDTFDTVISLIGYAENQETFDARAAETHAMYLHLHKLFDTYNSYADEGITSVCDVNRQAAVEPVKVDPILFGLLTFCKSNYELVNGRRTSPWAACFPSGMSIAKRGLTTRRTRNSRRWRICRPPRST